MLSHFRPSLIMRHAIPGLFVAAVIVLGAQDAFAQYKNFGDVQKGIGSNLTSIPKLIAMVAYVIGTFFAASGLLKLKDWVIDSERNTLVAPLVRLAVASLLIYLPYVMVLSNGAIFGSEADGSATSVKIEVSAPRLNAFGKK